jgi:hypothetical protein
MFSGTPVNLHKEEKEKGKEKLKKTHQSECMEELP